MFIVYIKMSIGYEGIFLMQKITKAIIPAAGFGTRFLPATKSQPKEMLPVVDKPTIQGTIHRMAQSQRRFLTYKLNVGHTGNILNLLQHIILAFFLGVVDGDKIAEGLYTVRSLVEKPTAEAAPSNVAIMGRYIITPAIFDILEKTAPGAGNEIQLTDALKNT